MTNYLTAVDQLLRSDHIKFHWPEGGDELYCTVGNLESMVATMAYVVRQSTLGTLRLPSRTQSLRTEPVTGRIDPRSTKAVAISALEQAQQALQDAAAALRDAHEHLSGLLVDADTDNTPHMRPTLTVVRSEI